VLVIVVIILYLILREIVFPYLKKIDATDKGTDDPELLPRNPEILKTRYKSVECDVFSNLSLFFPICLNLTWGIAFDTFGTEG